MKMIKVIGVTKFQRRGKPILWRASYQKNGVSFYKYFPRRSLAIEQRREWEEKYGVPIRGNLKNLKQYKDLK